MQVNYFFFSKKCTKHEIKTLNDVFRNNNRNRRYAQSNSNEESRCPARRRRKVRFKSQEYRELQKLQLARAARQAASPVHPQDPHQAVPGEAPGEQGGSESREALQGVLRRDFQAGGAVRVLRVRREAGSSFGEYQGEGSVPACGRLITVLPLYFVF